MNWLVVFLLVGAGAQAHGVSRFNHQGACVEYGQDGAPLKIHENEKSCTQEAKTYHYKNQDCSSYQSDLMVVDFANPRYCRRYHVSRFKLDDMGICHEVSFFENKILARDISPLYCGLK